MKKVLSVFVDESGDTGFEYGASKYSINEYRKAVRKDSTLIDCYSDQLNSSINVAEVEHLISKEQADRLRARYFRNMPR